MLESFLSVTRAVAKEVQTHVAQQAPALAQAIDLPQRQRFAELLARGFDTFVHGLVRATRSGGDGSGGASSTDSGLIVLGPQPAGAASPAGGAAAGEDGQDGARRSSADDEAFAKKFAQLFLDMGGIFPKLAQVLSLRPDLITNETVLLELRKVQEECKRLPFDKAKALAAAESTAFAEGGFWQLRDWPQHVHAGSIAQVAPFVVAGRAGAGDGPADGDGHPDGVVKLTFVQMRETMEIDFRLLRSQLHWMEKSGQWSQLLQNAQPDLRPGLDALRPRHVAKLKEVWKIMVEMESEVLQEFDLSHEAECQQRGEVVLEGLLDSQVGGGWLQEWREEALGALLRPAGPEVASQAREAWRGAGATAGGQRPAGGWLSRLARRAYLGRALAEDLAEGQEHVARLQAALSRLQVRVPKVHATESGPHVLAMEFAKGNSLKQVLDMIARGGDDAQKAGAWFTVLLLMVIIPLWGKMLLVVGVCHADPHPGNFKVDGIPGLLEVDASQEPAAQAAVPGARPGLFRRLTWRSAATPEQEATPQPLSLSILDWGSCVDLDDALRHTLCRLVVSLGDLRRAQRESQGDADATGASQAVAEATQRAADCLRALGVHAEEDSVLAALGMALFDPAMRGHPDLRGRAEELGRSFRADSGLGKVLRVVAILVGICRELETRLNSEMRERMPAAAASRLGAAGVSLAEGQPFFELFLVELWRPFAEEGLA